MSKATITVPVVDSRPTEPDISAQDGLVVSPIDLNGAKNGDVVYDFNDDHTGTDVDRGGFAILYTKFAGHPGLDIHPGTGQVFISDVTKFIVGNAGFTAEAVRGGSVGAMYVNPKYWDTGYA